MVGPAGSGKTSLAERVPSLLPPLTDGEAEEVKKVYDRRHDTPPTDSRRPFRSPPPATTIAALIGGGRGPMPGEVSLAHQGVLFLDELPYFRRDALDALRAPLDRGQVTLHGLGRTRKFPARFILIGAMNACEFVPFLPRVPGKGESEGGGGAGGRGRGMRWACTRG